MRLLALLVLTATLAVATPEAEVTTMLHAQAAAWNTGDIPGFMSAYEQSDTLRFASGGDVTRGWQPTLERYLSRYPDRAAMGTLAFTDLELTVLAPDAVVVFGRWRLTREKDAPHGLFTLTVRRVGGRWRIVHDHTSSAK